MRSAFLFGACCKGRCLIFLIVRRDLKGRGPRFRAALVSPQVSYWGIMRRPTPLALRQNRAELSKFMNFDKRGFRDRSAAVYLTRAAQQLRENRALRSAESEAGDHLRRRPARPQRLCRGGRKMSNEDASKLERLLGVCEPMAIVGTDAQLDNQGSWGSC